MKEEIKINIGEEKEERGERGKKDVIRDESQRLRVRVIRAILKV